MCLNTIYANQVYLTLFQANGDILSTRIFLRLCTTVLVLKMSPFAWKDVKHKQIHNLNKTHKAHLL